MLGFLVPNIQLSITLKSLNGTIHILCRSESRMRNDRDIVNVWLVFPSAAYNRAISIFTLIWELSSHEYFLILKTCPIQVKECP